MVLFMDAKQKAILIVLSVLLVGLTTFTVVNLFRSNDLAATETTKIEKVVEAKPATTAVKQEPTQAPKTTATTSPSKEGRGILYTLLIILTVSLGVSVFLVFHLLSWRYRITDSQVSVVPNELLKLLEEQVGGYNQTTHYISEYIKRITQDREKTDAGILELQKAFAIFQESLDKKDKEIERYKKGYDSAIYGKFLRKFVKFYIDLKKEADAPENQQSAAVLNDMLDQLEDALLECNVELKAPAIMDLADEHKDIISGNKKTQTTNQPELHGKIADVLMPAFMLKTQAGEEVLREASIAVYVYEESEAA